MDMRITHPEFVKRRLVLSMSREHARPTLCVDGVRVPRSGLDYIVNDDTGRPRVVGVYKGFDGPSVSVGGQPAELTPELPWYARLLIAAPALMFFIGGLTGGLCGAAGCAGVNALWQSRSSQTIKLAGSLAIIAVAFIAWIVLAVGLQFLVAGLF